MLKETDYRETVTPQDPAAFCHLSEQELWLTELSDIMPILDYLSFEWYLDLNKKKDFEITYKILLTSILCN